MSPLRTAASAAAERVALAEQRLAIRETAAAPAARRAALDRSPAPGDALALAQVEAARRHLQQLRELAGALEPATTTTSRTEDR